ncbi:MAG: arginase [Flavobacteriales bacterium]|mgnify:FL=1|jgi:arginase|nr:arginase [Flavobacteriales bacterium]MBT3572311.1 arginase [Flavobacteriales bacterium]MBT4202166.1 arginase [Flavobacteriales bacterium]MBT6624080.1 arginase [Flavobacteriales bacterium]MBT7382558.1 arginase [Flavobacteriales bacterium]
MIQLIGSLSEIGAGTRGSSLGLQAMQLASLSTNPQFFKDQHIEMVREDNAIMHRENPALHGKYIVAIADMYDRISSHVKQVMSAGDTPFLISGDHSNAGGSIAGIHQAFPNKTLGVVWIDAHTDLHSPYTSPSGNVHGMPLATAIADDNLASATNQPSEAVVAAWERMKGPSQRLQTKHLAFVGVRSTEVPEDNLLKKYSIPNHTVASLRQEGVAAIVNHIKIQMQHCDHVYVSFDVDSMDPSVSCGTGTPVEGGLRLEEASDLLQMLASWDKVSCMEFTEINPLLDLKGNAMGEAAFALLDQTVETLADRSHV